jgi:ferredoxin-thioredoxin reductase catalytic subunit
MAMKLNPDKEKVKEVGAKVKANNGYCPCMFEQNEDTKCPCEWKREEDTCICGLYVKDEK